MRQLRVAATVLGCAIGAAMLLGSPVGAQDNDLQYNVDNAIRFRANLGLRADRDYVQESVTDHERFSNMEWGIPLTPGEAEQVDGRKHRQQQMQDAVDYALKQSDYAGMMFDQLDGGKPIFWFTGGIVQHRAELEARSPSGTEISVRRADASWDELEAIADSISGDFQALGKDGIAITEVHPDARENAVVVELTKTTDGAQKTLRSRYDTDHIVTHVLGAANQDACTGRDNCGNPGASEEWKGGIKIHAVGFPSSALCTSSWLARKGSNLVLITAGHCIANLGGVGNNWEENGNTIGDALGDTIVAGTSAADAGWIDIDYGAGLSPKNAFFASSTSDIRGFTGTQANGAQQVGDFMCRSALKSGYLCGNVDATGATRNVDGHAVTNLKRTDFDAIPGDSGGPYFFGNTAWGLHADSLDGVEPPDPGHSWYTTVTRAGTESGTDICLSASC